MTMVERSRYSSNTLGDSAAHDAHSGTLDDLTAPGRPHLSGFTLTSVVKALRVSTS